MAHLHFHRTVYKGGGQAARGRVTYIAREAQRAAVRQLTYVAGEERGDLVETGSRNLPAWSQGNAATYFQAAEQYEAKRSIAWTDFEEWKITLPRELTQRQNTVLMESLLAVIAGDRLPLTYALHCPSTLDGQHAQPHLH